MSIAKRLTNSSIRRKQQTELGTTIASSAARYIEFQVQNNWTSVNARQSNESKHTNVEYYGN